VKEKFSELEYIVLEIAKNKECRIKWTEKKNRAVIMCRII
jgi:hypothetical protein